MASERTNDFGALQQQVVNLENGHVELRRGFRDLDIKVDQGFESLGKKLDAKTTPQWQPIGILVSVMLAIGGAIIWPIREASTRQEAVIEVMRREGEARIVKLWDEHNKLAREHSYLQGQLHPLQAR